MAVLPAANIQWVDSSGKPTQALLKFMSALAIGRTGPYTEATNDASAAAAGVAVGQIYQSSGALRVRIK
jgi:hypothetical protein